MSLLSPPSISSSLAPYATLEDTARKRSRRARVCVCPRSVAIRLSRSAFNYPSTVRGEQEISRLRSLSLQPTRDDPIARFSIQSFEKSPISNTHPTDSRKRGGDRRATSCLARQRSSWHHPQMSCVPLTGSPIDNYLSGGLINSVLTGVPGDKITGRVGTRSAERIGRKGGRLHLRRGR